jgi:hypothetical protein
MSKLNKGQVRQGDVLLVAAKVAAGEAEPIASDGSVVLAHGEVTGHRHRFERASEAQALTGSVIRQLIVNVPAALLHEEHSPPTVEPGIYDLPAQVEWTDANEPRKVED